MQDLQIGALDELGVGYVVYEGIFRGKIMIKMYYYMISSTSKPMMPPRLISDSLHFNLLQSLILGDN